MQNNTTEETQQTTVIEESNPDKKLPTTESNEESSKTENSKQGEESNHYNQGSEQNIVNNTLISGTKQEGHDFTKVKPELKEDHENQLIATSEPKSNELQEKTDVTAVKTNLNNEKSDTISKENKTSAEKEHLRRMEISGELFGCVVSFQYKPINERPDSTGLSQSIQIPRIEMCATKCYEEGCVGAVYDPKTKECLLEFGGPQQCSNGPQVLTHRTKEPVWIHCTSCTHIEDVDEIEKALSESDFSEKDKTTLEQGNIPNNNEESGHTQSSTKSIQQPRTSTEEKSDDKDSMIKDNPTIPKKDLSTVIPVTESATKTIKESHPATDEVLDTKVSGKQQIVDETVTFEHNAQTIEAVTKAAHVVTDDIEPITFESQDNEEKVEAVSLTSPQTTTPVIKTNEESQTITQITTDVAKPDEQQHDKQIATENSEFAESNTTVGEKSQSDTKKVQDNMTVKTQQTTVTEEPTSEKKLPTTESVPKASEQKELVIEKMQNTTTEETQQTTVTEEPTTENNLSTTESVPKASEEKELVIEKMQNNTTEETQQTTVTEEPTTENNLSTTESVPKVSEEKELIIEKMQNNTTEETQQTTVIEESNPDKKLPTTESVAKVPNEGEVQDITTLQTEQVNETTAFASGSLLGELVTKGPSETHMSTESTLKNTETILEKVVDKVENIAEKVSEIFESVTKTPQTVNSMVSEESNKNNNNSSSKNGSKNVENEKEGNTETHSEVSQSANNALAAGEREDIPPAFVESAIAPSLTAGKETLNENTTNGKKTTSDETTLKSNNEEKVTAEAKNTVEINSELNAKNTLPSEQKGLDESEKKITTHSLTTEVVSETLSNPQKVESTDAEFAKKFSNCSLSFQVENLANAPSELHNLAKHEVNASSIHSCAESCFKDGCTGAFYEPLLELCSLTYEENQRCSLAKTYKQYVADDAVWIHCISCDSLYGQSSSKKSEDFIINVDPFLIENNENKESGEIKDENLKAMEPAMTNKDQKHEQNTESIGNEAINGGSSSQNETAEDGKDVNQALKHGISEVITNVARVLLNDSEKELSQQRFLNEETLGRPVHVEFITSESSQEALNTSNKLVLDGLVEVRNNTDKQQDASSFITTEPPVEAVSEIVDVLSKNKKLEDLLSSTTHSPNAQEQHVVDFVDGKVKHILLEKLVSKQNGKTQGTSETKVHETGVARSECRGRILFQKLPADILPQLNVTSEVPVKSPFECARKCYETENCALAGYVSNASSENSDNAVCLLTSNEYECNPQLSFVQHSFAASQFILSCIQCSNCTYSVTPLAVNQTLENFNMSKTAKTVDECAQICYENGCVTAQYDPSLSLCLMSMEKDDIDKCPEEILTPLDEVLPSILRCVKCASV
uniref:Apple domain-containing protein n=1 Tax=Syphacia muris TaxID=451379 RepID=A0A0N5AR84_9BILA